MRCTSSALLEPADADAVGEPARKRSASLAQPDAGGANLVDVRRVGALDRVVRAAAAATGTYLDRARASGRATLARLPRVIGEHLRHARRQLARRLDVQELIRPMRVRVRAEHAGDQELRAREIARRACP